MKGTAAAMSDTVFDFRNLSSETPGDWQRWLAQQGEDNQLRLERLRRGLRRARREELTPRQQQMLTLCYDEGLGVNGTARRLGVNPSTVSRTLQRARRRLYRCLRYGL